MPGSPTFIWVDSHGRGRNRYALFRKTFRLDADVESARLDLFADTRYRLTVNGQTVCHGPARFFVARPRYDRIDLTPWLRPGQNVLAVVVNSYHGVSFHSETSIAGLWARGEVRHRSGPGVSLNSDETWRAIESPGHRRETVHLSFALNPGESLDARSMPTGWEQPDFDDASWPAAVPLDRQDHWGALDQRPIPMLDESRVRPWRLLSTWTAAPPAEEDVYSLVVATEGGNEPRTQATVTIRTRIYSPREQTVSLGSWWGRHWLNGESIEGENHPTLPLRQQYEAPLRAGWNTLIILHAFGLDCWDFYLALPRAANLELSATGSPGSAHTFLVAGPWEGEAAARAEALPWPLVSPDDLPAELGAWRPWPRDRDAGTPCRQRAWKRFERLPGDPALAGDVPNLTVNVPAAARRVGARSLALLFDFGGEMLGRPVIDCSAAAGTTIDLSYTERLLPDGSADVHSRHFVEMVERYTARQGRQTWQTFHPRGFRYLELLVTGDLERFELHRLELTRALYPVESVGSFECSDPLLNEVWHLGPPTLRACMEDAYLDCPWRERGLYVGDFLVEYQANRAAFGDAALFRRSIELFFEGQGDNGFIRPGAHGLPPGRHPDYTAILVEALWTYWATTGDLKFVGEHAARLERLLDAMDAWRTADSPLVDASDLKPYVDLSHLDRGGVCCTVNCFVQRAYAAGADLLGRLDRREASSRHAGRADELAEAIREAFWDERRGVFLDRRAGDVDEPEPSVASNALAIVFGMATPEQAGRAGDWLSEAMANNFRVVPPTDNADCNVTSYFSYYALRALYALGRAEPAERFMRAYWGRMLGHGAWTAWEYFVDRTTASRCHAWSASPTHYLSERVLGVRLAEAGSPQRVVIDPTPGTLTWARGVYPHAAGPIRVSWRRSPSGGLELDYDAPPGVEVVPPANRRADRGASGADVVDPIGAAGGT